MLPVALFSGVEGRAHFMADAHSGYFRALRTGYGNFTLHSSSRRESDTFNNLVDGYIRTRALAVTALDGRSSTKIVSFVLAQFPATPVAAVDLK